MSGLLCSGNVHMALLNADGSFAGFLDLTNAIKLGIKAGEGDEKQRTSKQRDNFGEVLDSVIIPTPTELSIDLDEGDADTVGMALMGAVTTLTVASQTRTSVAQSITALDTWLDLGDRQINSSGFSITDDATTPAAYVLGEDYVVDLTMGLIKFLGTGSAQVGDVFEKNYTTRAVTGKRITGAKKNQLRVRILGNMKNLANGKSVVVDIPDSTLKSASEIDLLSGDFTTTSLTGTIRGSYTIDQLDT